MLCAANTARIAAANGPPAVCLRRNAAAPRQAKHRDGEARPDEAGLGGGLEELVVGVLGGHEPAEVVDVVDEVEVAGPDPDHRRRSELRRRRSRRRSARSGEYGRQAGRDERADDRPGLPRRRMAARPRAPPRRRPPRRAPGDARRAKHWSGGRARRPEDHRPEIAGLGWACRASDPPPLRTPGVRWQAVGGPVRDERSEAEARGQRDDGDERVRRRLRHEPGQQPRRGHRGPRDGRREPREAAPGHWGPQRRRRGGRRRGRRRRRRGQYPQAPPRTVLTRQAAPTAACPVPSRTAPTTRPV